MLDLNEAFATFPTLASERFILREIDSDDAPAIFRVMSDPRVMRYFGRPPMSTIDQAYQRVEAFAAAFREQNGVRWAITERASGQYLGSCGFWRLEKHNFRAEIGYELAPAWWGKAVMPEAVGAALAFGFLRMGLHSVEAQIHPANTGSRRVLEKLGFVQEGYFRENFFDPTEQQFSDTAVFSLLKATWLGRLGA